MSDNNPLLMQALGTQMRYMAQRQTLLSQNIANLDTPGFRSQDLKKLDFANLVAVESNHLAVQRTASNHMEPLGARSHGPYRQEKVANPFEVTPMGNSVNLEEEMAKVSETNEKFQTSSSLLKKYTTMMRTAASNR